MSKLYVAIGGLVIVGAAAAVMLKPGDKEMALMNLKDKRFEQALVAYESQASQGHLTADVVTPLVDLYLQNAKVDEAIKVMEQYLQQNPADVEARRRLGTLYQYAQRPDDYLRNLEELNKVASTPEILKELSDIYNYNAQYEKQIEALQALAEKGESVPPERLSDLANLLASQKRYEEAIAALQGFKAAYPQAMTFGQVELLVSLLMDQNRAADARNEASDWMKRNAEPNATELARLLDIIHYKGARAEALELAQAHESLAQGNDYLTTSIIRLYIANGKESEAFGRMIEMHKEHTLPADLYQDLFDQAVRHGDFNLVVDVARSVDVDKLGEMQLIYLVELSKAHRQPRLLESINEKLAGRDLAESMPTLDVVLAYANGDKNDAAKLQRMEERDNLTNAQVISMARAAANAGEYATALRVMLRLPEPEKMSDPEVGSLGELYMLAGKADQGYELIAKAREERNAAIYDTLWLRLQTATGRSDEVRAWLANNRASATPSQLTDLFFIATNNGQRDLAVDLAEALYEKENSTQNGIYLSEAYIQSGRLAEALPLLREARDQSVADENRYLNTLAKLANKNAEARKELGDYLGAKLASGRIPEKRKIELVYLLIGSGNTHLAMPHIREYAYRDGGSWGALYIDQLTKGGNRDEVRKYRLARAARAGVSDHEKRGHAFALLDEGFRGDSVRIFQDLAVRSGPKSADAKQVLYLWGPRPGTAELAWLTAQAEKSTGAVQEGWISHLFNAGGYQDVVRLIETRPAMLDNPALADHYLQALTELGQYGKVGDTAMTLAAKTNDPARLRKLAAFASGSFQRAATRAVYERLLSVKPGDAEALRNLGLIAHSQADYSESDRYLSEYFRLPPQQRAIDDREAEAYYIMAELLRRKEKEGEALGYYQRVVEQVDRMAAPSPDQRSMAAQSQARLGKLDDAKQRMNKLLAEYPNDKIVQADAISLLVEFRQYEEARRVYATSQQLQPVTVVKLTSFEIPASYVTSQRVSPDGREVLVNLAVPSDRVPQLKTLERSKPEWLNYVTTGYDSALIVANPDYTLTSGGRGGDLELSAQKGERKLAGNLYEQALLRLELLSARIDLETGEHNRAVRTLNAELEKHPKDAQLMGFTANAEYFTGRWARAWSLLDEAHRLTPENEDIAELLRTVSREHGQHAKLDHEWVKLGDSVMNITTFSGFVYVMPYTRVGIEVQNNFVDGENLRRADGRFGNFDDTKQRAHLFVRHDTEDGATVQASLYANNDTAGAGLMGGIVTDLGRTEVYGEYQRPYWEYTEGVLDDATRDRIGINHMVIINQDWRAGLGTAWNRYNVYLIDDVSQSITVNGFVSYVFYRDSNDMWTVSYSLDGEYRTDDTYLIDGTGAAYSPFPMLSREVHAITVSNVHAFSEFTMLETYAGAAVDRLGGAGPLAGFRLTHEFNEWLEGQIRADAGFSSVNDDGVIRAGTYLKVRF